MSGSVGVPAGSGPGVDAGSGSGAGAGSGSRRAEWEAAAAELAALRTLWPAEVPRRPAVLPAGPGLAETVRHWAAERPDAVAVSYYGWEETWSELAGRVAATAGWLASHGVGTGDRVAVFMGNCPQYVHTFLAVAWLGAVYVPSNPMYRAEELRHQLEDSGAVHLFAPPAARAVVDSALARLDHEVAVTWTDPAAVFAVPGAPAPTAGLPSAVPSREDAGDWERVLASAPAEPVPVDPDRLAALNYTGGTTGRPKGCEHTIGHMAYTAASAMAGSGTAVAGEKREVTLGFLAMFWIAGQNLSLLLPIYGGGEIAVLGRWHPRVALETIADRGVTRIVSPADGYGELLELLASPECRELDLSSLEQCQAVSFVRKLDIGLRREWEARTGITLREASFGMTETHTSDTFTLGLQTGDMDLRAQPVYCGFPVPGTEIVVVDEELHPVPVGQEGEILVHSPSVTTGYWHNPRATADTLVEGWLRTGDTGRFDEHGALTYLARTKEMIKVKGMSVFPSEVESLLRMHPGVQTVAVAPREDPERGQVPVAFVVPAADVPAAEGAPAEGPLTAEALTAWARENMAVYKVPEFVFVEEMPMTATGKIRKAVLLEEHLA
ncbi:AMP-binding protein [Brevibacterium album]|uniref:AMP-binding protein n=1 Tax=Brevibacterium album TaxID=417948 RepID=UPI001B7FBAAA|nr:AMP-binding protein [Brevibacterium album]